jgi:hypothetical protein
LYIPGGLWEFIVLPAWLIFKGFNIEMLNEKQITSGSLGFPVDR